MAQNFASPFTVGDRVGHILVGTASGSDLRGCNIQQFSACLRLMKGQPVEPILFNPIGVIHTPFPQPKGAPIQPSRSSHAKGRVEVFREFIPGLSDLDGFSHITLVYYFHLSKGFDLTVTPYLDTQLRGLFSTRAPRRPNAIGLSVVRLLGIEGGVIDIEDVDMVDGTPLLDIKPFVPAFEDVDSCRLGWLEGKTHRAGDTSADGRFSK